MYSSLVVAVSALAGFTFAQTSIPQCATNANCITLPASCNANPSCICNDQEWIAQVSCCVFQNCNEADQQAALAYAQTVCTPVGATLPSTASCASNSTSSASSSGSSSGSSTATSATGSAASSASSALSSITSSASSVASAASSSASAATASAASSAFGYQVVAPGAGGLLGAIIGAAALL